MKITKEDSEHHGLLALFLNQNARWDGLPTGNVAALDSVFKWFNNLGKRVDEALKEEAELEASTEDPKATDPKAKKKAV